MMIFFYLGQRTRDLRHSAIFAVSLVRRERLHAQRRRHREALQAAKLISTLYWLVVFGVWMFLRCTTSHAVGFTIRIIFYKPII